MRPTPLPVLETELDETAGKLIKKPRDIKVKIDTSLFAEERWEKNFPAQAKTETLFNYVERVQAKGITNTDTATVLSNLKALYCFMEGDDIADFKSFLQLFNLADVNHLQKLVDKIKFVFEIALQSAVDTKN